MWIIVYMAQTNTNLTENEKVMLVGITEAGEKGLFISKTGVSKRESVLIWNACVGLEQAKLVTMTKTTIGTARHPLHGYTVKAI